MISFQCTSENFSSSSSGHKMSSMKLQKKKPDLSNCIVFKEILSPMSNEDNSESMTTTQTDSSSNDSLIEDGFGQIILPSTLYTKNQHKRLCKTNLELPKIYTRVKRKNISWIPNQEKLNEKFIQMTNQEDINDFNDYTRRCFEIIDELKKPSDEEIKPYYVKLSDEDVKAITSGNKKLAVFDLDETLSHCELTDYINSDVVLQLSINGKEKKFGLNIRPYLYECLKKVKEHYILVLYTASQQLYGETVVNYLDPNKELFSYRLYRHNCIQIKIDSFDDDNQKQLFYIKDLRIFHQIPLSKIIIIDNSALSFAFQLENGIPILPFYSKKSDSEMLNLETYLLDVVSSEDITKINKKWIQYFKKQCDNENIIDNKNEM